MNILLCPLSDGGYLYPAIAAGRELARRGHRVSLLGRSTAAPFAAEAGLPFAAAEEYGGQRAFSAASWGSTGAAQYRATVRAARQAGADLLVTSVLCNGTLLAAETLDLPVVVIGLSVHLWNYRRGGADEPQWGRTRQNRTEECLALYAAVRDEVGLAGRTPRLPDTPLHGDALLLRGIPELEYPGTELPERTHHVGPLNWEPAADEDELRAVTDRLDRCGKPVVYVHLGRFFGGGSPWPRLNTTFTGGRFQAVVEQGRSTDPRPAPGADVLLVRRPWLGPLLDRAGLVLTNATTAPVLAALERGLPLGVSPNGSEQPVLAAACLRAGAAVHVPNTQEPDQRARLGAAWQDDRLRENARRLGHRLAGTPGAARAADLVEAAQQSATPRENHDDAIGRSGHRDGAAAVGGPAPVDPAARRVP